MSSRPLLPSNDADAIVWLMSVVRDSGDVFARPTIDPTIHTRLREELGLDSIALVSLFYAVTDALSIEIEERRVASWETLGDVIRCLRSEAAA